MAAHKKRKRRLNINLLIKQDAEISFSGQLVSWIFTYGRYIIIITQIVVLSVFFARFKLDRDHTDLKESVSQKQAIMESVSDLEVEIKSVQQRLAFIRQIETNQKAISKILHFLQENTPTDTTFSTLNVSSDKIIFNASAGSLGSFSHLISQLQQENKFTQVSLEDIQRRSDGRVEFRINANINIKEFNNT